MPRDEYEPFVQETLAGAGAVTSDGTEYFASDEETHPGAPPGAPLAAPVPQENRPGPATASTRTNSGVDIFYPFRDEDSYELARFIVESDLTVEATDRLLKAKFLREEATQDFRSSHTLRKLISRMPDGLGWDSWYQGDTGVPATENNEADDGSAVDGAATVKFWFRNILRVARFLVNQPAFAQYMRWEPVKIYNRHKTRVYRDVNSGKWWWQQQVALFPPYSSGADQIAGPGPHGRNWQNDLPRDAAAAHFHVGFDSTYPIRWRPESMADLHDDGEPECRGPGQTFHAHDGFGGTHPYPYETQGTQPRSG